MDQVNSIAVKRLLHIFVFFILLIEINFGVSRLNLGNIFLMLGACFVLVQSLKFRRMDFVYGMFVTKDFVVAFALAIYFIISAFWSVSKVDTIVQATFFLLPLIACYLLRDADVRDLVHSILFGAIIISILSLLALVVSRGYALQPVQSTSFPELRGVFKHQQRLGLFVYLALGLGVLSFLNNEVSRVWGKFSNYRFIILVFLFCVGIFAFARLFMVSAAIAFILSVACSRSVWLKRLIISAFVFGLCYQFFSDYSAYLVSSYESGELSLTGRILVWERSLTAALENPILGHGFGVFNSPQLDYLWLGYRPPHAHNSFIQAFFDGGWIGFGILIALVWQHFVKSNNLVSKNSRSYSYSSFVFFLCLICGLTGVTYAGKPSVIYTLLFLFIAMECNLTIKFAKFRR